MILDAKQENSYYVGHEQARYRQARPNPFHADGRRFDALCLAARGREINTVAKLLVEAGRSAPDSMTPRSAA